jgi:hypothetical protein
VNAKHINKLVLERIGPRTSTGPAAYTVVAAIAHGCRGGCQQIPKPPANQKQLQQMLLSFKCIKSNPSDHPKLRLKQLIKRVDLICNQHPQYVVQDRIRNLHGDGLSPSYISTDNPFAMVPCHRTHFLRMHPGPPSTHIIYIYIHIYVYDI